MILPLFIAGRYLFSKKKQNAINIISAISVAGVTVGTAALLIILSVFNGMDQLFQKSTNSFFPDLIISAKQGKTMQNDSTVFDLLANTQECLYYYPVIEEKAIVKHKDIHLPITVKGVDKSYFNNSDIKDFIVSGSLKSQDDSLPNLIAGYNVAYQLGIERINDELAFYYPNKNYTSAMNALRVRKSYPSSLFAIQQEIDAKYIISDLSFARELFNIKQNISKIEIKLKNEDDIETVKEKLNQQLLAKNDAIKIEDKYQINYSFFAMLRSEKIAIFIILLFILLIASFNIVGSISMLIIDKKEDLSTYKAIGLKKTSLMNIFKTEGMLISSIGTTFGVTIGVVVCLLQKEFGIITLGEGNYIIDAYPVELIFSDISLIVCSVLAIGFIASTFPVRYLINKLIKTA